MKEPLHVRDYLAFFWSAVGAWMLGYILVKYGYKVEILTLIIGLISGTIVGGVFGTYFSAAFRPKTSEAATGTTTANITADITTTAAEAEKKE